MYCNTTGHVISCLGSEAKEWVDYCEPTLSAMVLVKQSHRLHWAGPSNPGCADVAEAFQLSNPGWLAGTRLLISRDYLYAVRCVRACTCTVLAHACLGNFPYVSGGPVSFGVEPPPHRAYIHTSQFNHAANDLSAVDSLALLEFHDENKIGRALGTNRRHRSHTRKTNTWFCFGTVWAFAKHHAFVSLFLAVRHPRFHLNVGNLHGHVNGEVWGGWVEMLYEADRLV